MHVRRFDDPAAYTQHVAPLLLRAPARHNLFLGLLDVLRRHPAIYPTFHLWAAESGEEVVGAVMQTPPHDVVLARPTVAGAVEALAAAVAGEGVLVPGVLGGVEDAQAFAQSWTARHGGAVNPGTRQGIYELTAVRPTQASGNARRATSIDLTMLVAWQDDFLNEAAPHFIRDPETQFRRMSQLVDDGGYWLWEIDGRVVSMTGVSPAPPDGARVGPVYTPPPQRGNGYASALVAHVSDDALAAGARACYLHTDLANPTSNKIYRRIGYEWVCEVVELRFAPAVS